MSLFEKALTKAKVGLLASPHTMFFACLCFGMKHVEDPSIDTACTNGLVIRYNPDFFLGLNKDNQIALVAHETMHIAYKHSERLNTKDHKKWNIAGDFVINNDLVKAGFKISSEWLYNPQYDGMSTDEVYRLLLDDLGNPIPDLEAGLTSEESNQIDGMLVKAVMMAKQASDRAGSIPGNLERYIDRLLNPTLPWQSILRKYMNSVVKEDYSYSKINKRYLPMLMPSLHSQGMVTISIFVDASGSVKDSEFLTYISEIFGIFKIIKPTSMELVSFDTEIKDIRKIKSVSDFKDIKFKAGGGTEITDVIDYINLTKPTISLIFTDGYFYFRDTSSKSPIIWMINNNKGFIPNYGKAIHFNTK